MTTTPKQSVLQDIYNILYRTELSYCPDNWDVLVSICKTYMTHVGLTFKEKREIPALFGAAVKDSEAFFFDAACPGAVPSLTAFECTYAQFFEWEIWYLKCDTTNAFEGVAKILEKI